MYSLLSLNIAIDIYLGFRSGIINTMKRNPFGKNSRETKRVTPEGEPLEETGTGGGFPGGGRGGFFGRGSGSGRISNPFIKIIVPAVIGIIIVAIAVTGSVKIVDAGYRGVR
jgi:hypothetical protein